MYQKYREIIKAIGIVLKAGDWETMVFTDIVRKIAIPKIGKLDTAAFITMLIKYGHLNEEVEARTQYDALNIRTFKKFERDIPGLLCWMNTVVDCVEYMKEMYEEAQAELMDSWISERAEFEREMSGQAREMSRTYDMEEAFDNFPNI